MSLWGGRFDEPPAAALWRFTVSTADRRLLPFDVQGSLAHVAMLGEVGLLTPEEVAELTARTASRPAVNSATSSGVSSPTSPSIATWASEPCTSKGSTLASGFSVNDSCQTAIASSLFPCTHITSPRCAAISGSRTRP